MQQVSGEWYQVHTVTKVKTVETDTAVLIHSLQENGYRVIGLTTDGLGTPL